MRIDLNSVGTEFTFDARMEDASKRTRFYKDLYGHNVSSHKKRYTYIREGILSNLRHLKPTRSTVILSIKDAVILRNFLKKFKDVQFDERLVILSEQESRALGLPHPEGWRKIYEELKGNENTVFSVDF